MAFFGRFWTIFCMLAHPIMVSCQSTDRVCPCQALEASNPSKMADIIYATLMRYPQILESVFQKNPHILWNAQQRMIQEFSTQVGEDVYQHTLKTLESNPTLWNEMQQARLTDGRKHIVAFLDPLCAHSALLLKNMIQLAPSSQNDLAFCPHWVTHPLDKKGQMVARALLAAHQLGQIRSFIDRLIVCIEKAQAINVIQLAADLGLNMESFQTHMFSPSTEQHMTKARQHFSQFQFQGFPVIFYSKEDQGHPDYAEKPIEIIEGNPHSVEELAQLLLH